MYSQINDPSQKPRLVSGERIEGEGRNTSEAFNFKSTSHKQ